MTTLPGMANAHSHAFHRVLRGRTEDDDGTFWNWRDAMYAASEKLSPDTYFALARAVYSEMIMAGWTGVAEFHYVHHQPGGTPYDDPNAMGAALAEAAKQAGIRLTLLDVAYLSGGLTDNGHQPLNERQRRFSDGSVDAWLERANSRPDWGDHVTLGYAVHSVRAVPREALRQIGEALQWVETPIHIHLSEQTAENTATKAFYGVTPTQLLADSGLLRPQTSVIHATHLTSTDISLLAEAGVTAVFCPTTERELADGVGPGRKLADNGVRLALGSDSQAVIDPFLEMQALETDERLIHHSRGRFTPIQLARAAVDHGWGSLGFEVPPEDDQVIIAADSVRTAGTDPEQFMFAATAADVQTVVCQGETIVDDGFHRLGDIGPLLAEAINDVLPEA